MQPDGLSRIIGMHNRGAWLPLQCGPLALNFDPGTAALREIRLNGREVIQAMGPVVRERNWGTVLPRMDDFQHESADDGFRLTFAARCQEREVDFAWSGEIVGQMEGILRFHLEGEARSTFLRNRIGFCILYPGIECAGKPCIAETVCGTKEEGAFPELISPRQPFRNLRSFRYEALPGVWVELYLEGDTFEMEDHRNWTDDSFKIYSTPLELPFPVELPAGARVVQTITLTLAGMAEKRNVPVPVYKEDDHSTLRLAEASPTPLPQIGLGAASHGKPLTPQEKELLKKLALSHLRLDVTPAEPEWQEQLRQAAEEAQSLGVGLEVALFLTNEADAELAGLARTLERLQPPVVRWLIYHRDQRTTPADNVRKAREVLVPRTPNAQIGGGTNAYFAELNRERPPIDLLDCVCYTINPQVHAFDRASLVENLEGQAPTVQSARAFCGGLPLVVSPITLKPRFNPYATGQEPAPGREELPPQVDVRQSTLFAAGWTLGSLKAMSKSGVHSVTYYETTGWRGVMETEEGSPLPQVFPSTPGELFPMFHVFRDVGEFAGGEALPLVSSAPRKVTGMALRKDRRSALLCANLTPESQKIQILLPAAISLVFVRQTDATNLEAWRRDPSEADLRENRRSLPVTEGRAEWVLPPFAYARFDGKE